MNLMTTRNAAHKLLDQVPDSELDTVAEYLASRTTTAVGYQSGNGADDTDSQVKIPHGWKIFADGTPQPNWELALERSRASH